MFCLEFSVCDLALATLLIAQEILNTMRAALAAIDRDAEARQTLVPFKYFNYADTVQDAIGMYSSVSVKRLQDESLKYDPEGLFQKGVPGGWKLFT